MRFLSMDSYPANGSYPSSTLTVPLLTCAPSQRTCMKQVKRPPLTLKRSIGVSRASNDTFNCGLLSEPIDAQACGLQRLALLRRLGNLKSQIVTSGCDGL